MCAFVTELHQCHSPQCRKALPLFMSLLPSKREIIVIDDDDHEKGETKNVAQGEQDGKAQKETKSEDTKPSATTAKESTGVASLQQILPHLSHKVILKQLRACNGDLEQAADQLLRSTTTVSSVRRPKKARSTIEGAKKLLQPTQRALFVKAKPRSAAKYAEKAEDIDNPNTELSVEWHAAYQKALRSESKVFFDATFGPVPSSLHGRQDVTTKDDTIQCRCGIPAAARQVQSDGPNYGRFYLCCGLVLRQKRRAAVALVKADSPVAKDSPRKQPCQFFQWDVHGSLNGGYASSSRFGLMGWQAFGVQATKKDLDDTYLTPTFCLYKNRIGPEQVQQGAIGNCWFLSALAVVAEKPYLVRQILPHTTLNRVGCYQVNLCLDGAWQTVLVDSHLPVIYRDVSKQPIVHRKKREGIPVPNQPGVVAVPAFCAAPQGQLWPALVEKAYAKVHGSYQQLSGGFIAEGLSDLTGAPCETILLEEVDAQLLWARLLSFAQAGFCMGVATSGRTATRGLVNCHAYSILDVLQLDNVVVGEQAKLTDYFGTKASPAAKVSSSSSSPPRKTSTSTIRLVRIRNPWGTREWKGDWSAQSVQWTHKLRQRLPDSWKQGDGTFFMSFEDMLKNFNHLDVCKTQPGWHHTGETGSWGHTMDPLRSSKQFYRLKANVTTMAFISLIQPKKRANTHTTYWYTDPSLVILKRPIGCTTWTETASCSLSGVQRITTADILLEGGKFEYMCVPFSCGAPSDDTPFRIIVYSAKPVKIQSVASNNEKDVLPPILAGIHGYLLQSEFNLTYPLGQKALLLCSPTNGGCYFVGLNASPYYVSLRLTIHCTTGILNLYGDTRASTLDIAPGSQKILFVLSGTGKSSSTATQCPFRYTSAVETKAGKATSAAIPMTTFHLGASVPLSTTGERLAAMMAGELPLEGCRGEDCLDTYAWIPQIGKF